MVGNPFTGYSKILHPQPQRHVNILTVPLSTHFIYIEEYCILNPCVNKALSFRKLHVACKLMSVKIVHLSWNDISTDYIIE